MGQSFRNIDFFFLMTDLVQLAMPDIREKVNFLTKGLYAESGTSLMPFTGPDFLQLSKKKKMIA